MAAAREEISLDHIKETITCGHCNGLYKDPRYLPCLHSYCHGCIEDLCSVNIASGVFACPACNQICPTRGLDGNGFKVNYTAGFWLDIYQSTQENDGERNCDICRQMGKTSPAVSKCMSGCNEQYCKACQDNHRLSRLAKEHFLLDLEGVDIDSITKQLSKQTFFCKEHDNKALEVYCNNDQAVICQSCHINKHVCHDTEHVQKHEQSRHNDLADVLTLSDQHLRQYDDAITDCQQAIEKFENEKESCIESLQKDKEETIAMITSHYANLEQEVEIKSRDPIKKIQSELDKLKAEQDNIKMAKKHFDNLDNKVEIANLIPEIRNRKQAWMNIPQFQISNKCYIKPVPSICTDGKIKLADIEECDTFEINEDQYSVASYNGSLTNSNRTEQDTFESSAAVSAPKKQALSSRFSGFVAKLIPQKQSTSSTNLPIQERETGQTALMRSLGGVQMYKPKISKGKKISHIGAIGADTVILVKGKTTMETFVLDENFKGKHLCKCEKCRCMVVTHDECIVLHDEAIDVYKQNRDWQHQRSINRPLDIRRANIAMNEFYKELIIADTKISKFVFIDYETGMVRYTNNQTEEQQVNYEMEDNITVNQNNDIIVSSLEKKSITGYNSRGAQVLHYTGEGEHTLSAPAGICVNRQNDIIVADRDKDNVQLLSQDGIFQKVLLSGKEGLEGPCSVAVSNDGYLLVGDRVGQIFKVQY